MHIHRDTWDLDCWAEMARKQIRRDALFDQLTVVAVWIGIAIVLFVAWLVIR